MTKDEALKMRVEQDEKWQKLVNRKWQGLTDDEIAEIIGHTVEFCHESGMIDEARAIEQALKEKNHG